MNERGSVVVRVSGPHGAPLRTQAFVRLYKQDSTALLGGMLTNPDSTAAFNNLPELGWYTVEVSAAGYKTQRKEFNVSDLIYTEVDVTLQLNSDSDDPSASYLSPSQLSAKAQKHVEKGVAEFRAGDFKSAQKEFTAAHNAAPRSPVTNYLLAILYLQTKDLRQAERYFTGALSIDPDHVPSLVGLGHVRYQTGDLQPASEVLQKAVIIDRKNWEALWLLSEVHLRAHDVEKARQEAQNAVEFGKGSANGAEFIEGEALAELGRIGESLKMLQAFLRDVPADPNAPLAREFAGKLELETHSTAADTPSPLSGSPLSVPASPPPKLLLPNWEPVSVDEERPPLADGVTCPADDVIRETGKRVAELVDSVNRIQATENVTHVELTTLGHPINTQKRKYDYLVSIAESDDGLPVVDEAWQGDVSDTVLGQISMFGLADLPLVFHPTLRGDFDMTCEGLGKWQAQATWLVYFRQRQDRPERIRSYVLNGQSSYGAELKGRAWISAQTHQIVRIEANLMKPLPQIGLGSEEDVIEYGPVPFHNKNTELWLPTSADIYFYFHHRPFHRHHSFTNYSLFSVSATQKIGQPAATEAKNDQK